MAELPDEIKKEIVMRLARFDTPGELVADLKKEGFDVDHRQIGSYDPTRHYFEAGDWARELFEATRRAYLEEVKEIPIANSGFRLNELNQMFLKAKRAGNIKLAAELAEQAAREVGGSFTNQREIGINDGRRPKDMPQEDRVSLLATVIAEALDKRNALAPPKASAA